MGFWVGRGGVEHCSFKWSQMARMENKQNVNFVVLLFTIVYFLPNFTQCGFCGENRTLHSRLSTWQG